MARAFELAQTRRIVDCAPLSYSDYLPHILEGMNVSLAATMNGRESLRRRGSLRAVIYRSKKKSVAEREVWIDSKRVLRDLPDHRNEKR